MTTTNNFITHITSTANAPCSVQQESSAPLATNAKNNFTANNIKNAIDYCKEKASKSGSSFYYSFLFLTAKQRQAITAVYAFCREVDDIVDDSNNATVAAHKLNFWQHEIALVFNGTPQHPVGIALQAALNHFPLQQQHLNEMLQGMFMDLQYQGYQTFSDLKLYCHRVASTAGMLAVEIFGYGNNSALEYARNLGIAFQLVNIIRDIGEDARRNRIYLPEDELAQFGITANDILTASCEDNPSFRLLMQHQAARAKEYYCLALSKLDSQDRHRQLSGLIMAEIYFTILEEIEKANFKVLKQRISITPLRKLWLAWKVYRREKKNRSR